MNILLLLVGGGKEFRFLGERILVLAPKSAILVTFYPKLCKFLQFSPKFAQILTFFPKICANFDIFSKNLCKFWQFLPKILQILTIFTKKRGETFSKNFRMWGKNKILWQNIHLCLYYCWCDPKIAFYGHWDQSQNLKFLPLVPNDKF